MTRPLPHNLEAERSLLGAVLVDNDVADDARDIVTTADFFEPAHAELWRLICDMRDGDRAITPLTLLADWTQDREIGHGFTASEYFHRLVEEAIPRVAAKEVARGIYNNALARRMIRTAQTLIDEAHEAPVSMGAEYLRDKYDSAFGDLFPTLASLGVKHIAEYGQSVITRVEELTRSDKDGGLPLGLTAIQDLTGPLMDGRLYIIGAESGSGKSVIGQQILEYVCRPESGKVGLLVQAEMEGEENATRALAAATAIRGDAIEQAHLTDEQYGQLVDANQALKAVRLYVDASSAPPVSRIRARVAKMRRKEGLDVVLIDDIMHLAAPEARMSYLDALPVNLQALKDMAKDFHIPVIVLTPLKSAYHDGDVRRPRIGDLTFPAAFNQKADVILFIHRPEYILGRNEPDKNDKDRASWEASMAQWQGRAEAILAKRRGGVDHGIRQLWFDKSRVRFADNAPREARTDQLAF